MSIMPSAHVHLLLADVGLPMVFVSLPAMLIALVPVIGIEAVILKKRLNLNSADAFRASGYANVASTFVGIPLAWIAAFISQMVFGIAIVAAFSVTPALQKIESHETLNAVFVTLLSPAWIQEGQSWTVPLAQAVLLIPFFFASVFIESKMVARTLDDLNLDKVATTRAVRDANLASYAGLLAIALGMMTWLAIVEWNSPGLFTKQVESRLSSAATTIDARQFGNSTWDRLFVFDPYTDEKGVCETIRLAPKKCSVPRLGQQVDESEFFIVFMQGQKISDTDRFPRKIANFDKNCTYREIPRDRATFNVERNSGPLLKCQ